jgi:hypothetical protein
MIRGELSFRMCYSNNDNKFVINQDDSYNDKESRIIQDIYEIEIDLSQQKIVPLVKEIGSRIQRIKEKWNLKDLKDIHVNSNGTLCLCVKTEECYKMPKGFILRDFFYNLLIPFLYYQSYYEKYGKEPWRSYSHGDLGILESYLNYQGEISQDIINLFLKSISDKILKSIKENISLKKQPCICNSNKIFKKCHNNVLIGYNRLKCDYTNTSLIFCGIFFAHILYSF